MINAQLKKSLLPLYLTQTFRGFAISLLTLFTAIYVYRTFSSTSLVFLFFLLYSFFKLLANLGAEELALKIGLKGQIFLGQTILVLAIAFLFLSLIYPAWLFLGAVFWGLSAGFYWFGWHGMMTKTAADGHWGEALGKQELFILIPLLASPILGGSLIDFFGYGGLFAASLVLVVFSLASLGPLSQKRTHYDTSPREVFSLFKTHRATVLAYFGEAASNSIYKIVFPLYLFLILGRELSLGGFFSLSLILVALVNFLIGQMVDIKGKRELIGFGSLFSFFIWVGRAIAGSVRSLFFLDVFSRVIEKMMGIPLSVLSYEKGLDSQATGRAVLFREMAISFGQISTCLLLLGLSLWGVKLAFFFWLAAFLVLFPLLLVK